MDLSYSSIVCCRVKGSCGSICPFSLHIHSANCSFLSKVCVITILNTTPGISVPGPAVALRGLTELMWSLEAETSLGLAALSCSITEPGEPHSAAQRAHNRRNDSQSRAPLRSPERPESRRSRRLGHGTEPPRSPLALSRPDPSRRPLTSARGRSRCGPWPTWLRRGRFGLSPLSPAGDRKSVV